MHSLEGASEAFILPAALAVLKEQRRWVLWKFVTKKGKKTKPPFQVNGEYASNDDPSTWNTYDAVAAAAHRFDGIGFVLTDTDVSAFDLDHCRDPETGEVDAWAKGLVERAASYTEVTKVNANGVSCEIYRKATRFITITGNVYRDAPLADIDAVIDAVIVELDSRRPEHSASSSGTTNVPRMLGSLLGVVGSGSYPSRSELLFAFITATMRARVADDAIVDACLNGGREGCGIFDHCRENGGEAYVKRQIERARERTGSALVLDPQDPMHSARELLAARFTLDGKRTLHRYRGAFWSWTGSYYAPPTTRRSSQPRGSS
jgi:hypothetical protein